MVTAQVLWSPHTFSGSELWKYEMIFNRNFTSIVSGTFRGFSKAHDSTPDMTMDFGDVRGDLTYVRYGDVDAPCAESEEDHSEVFEGDGIDGDYDGRGMGGEGTEVEVEVEVEVMQ